MSVVIWARITAIQIGVKQDLRHPYSFSLQIEVCIIYNKFIKTLPDQQKSRSMLPARFPLPFALPLPFELSSDTLPFSEPGYGDADRPGSIGILKTL
jgi:hypothetical protein